MRSSHTRAHSLWQSFVYAFQGFATGFSEERNFRVQCLYGLVVCLLLVWLQPPLPLCGLAVGSVFVLLAAELANSALERTVDLVCPGQNLEAGVAKDMAAAAVMLVSFASATVVVAVLSTALKGEALVGVGGLFLMFAAMSFSGREGAAQ